ncbi:MULTISPECIES: TetR/AcrR family transcriptional regulator [Corynebacterium]|uniref:TetR/AcrR family transcriptional regulator n=1 Tax=Corynebacterium TaxID=1716 RepID=UPI001031A0B1|nr:TetR/AcrR family transcriptional regulator [Corynebacterium neomassiliense]MCI1255246.1 TetR/AcrR family transcriptional regulator [Corynebacterium provencense]
MSDSGNSPTDGHSTGSASGSAARGGGSADGGDSSSRVPSPTRASQAGRAQRAERRRADILSAARTVFLRDGYHDAKLTGVAREAGCSVGTLYTYFTDRDALLAAVLSEVEEEMRAAGRPAAPEDGRPVSPAAQISATNRAYLASYRRNRAIMALMEQVAQADESFGRQRLLRADGFIDRNSRALQRLVDAGEIALDDPEMTATALSAAVSRLAYVAWVDGRFPDTDEVFERMCSTADRIWLGTLGLSPDSVK